MVSDLWRKPRRQAAHGTRRSTSATMGWARCARCIAVVPVSCSCRPSIRMAIPIVCVIEDADQRMYNLTIDEAHTFFVGEGRWLLVYRDLNFRQDFAAKMNSRQNYGAKSRIEAISCDL